MNANKPENPRAFPNLGDDPQTNTKTRYDGMTLRDYFAGKALASLRVGDWTDCKDGAKYCYDYADAMLAERLE